MKGLSWTVTVMQVVLCLGARPPFVMQEVNAKQAHAKGASRASLDAFLIAKHLDKTLPEFDDLESELASHGHTHFEGHTHTEDTEQTQEYDKFARSITNGTICETGFNAGHSALRFLAQSSAKLYEFDIGQHQYARVAANFLTTRYPGRLSNIWGNSLETIPKFHTEHPDVACNIVIVDGGHDEKVAMGDLTNFHQMAAAHHVLVIDDTPCQPHWCEGPTSAWSKLIAEGCVEETEAHTMGSHHGFRVGRYTDCERWH